MGHTLQPEKPVLVIDDDIKILDSTKLRLRSNGINNIICCQDSRDVMKILSNKQVSLILLDLIMPYINGVDILAETLEHYPDIPVIVITASNDIDTAVRCMKIGAFDYLSKPVEETRMINTIKRAIEIRQLRGEYADLKESMLSGELRCPEAFKDIVTADARMKAIFEYIDIIATTSRPVLITGETGVGKELFAKALHCASERKGNFIAVNVAGLDDNVFSDTLFGHVKGAFTDARDARNGLIESASGGTLFLDEIGDLNHQSQVKLLRLLQEGEYFHLGSDNPTVSDARIVVATNRDVEKLMEEGLFRRDLYYRLVTHRVHIPPLRERSSDLPLLINHCIEKAALVLNKTKPVPPSELLILLANYDFPGNVRELEAMIFHAVSNHKSGILSTAFFRSRIFKGNEKYSAEVLKGLDPIGFNNPGVKLPTLKQAEELLVKEALKRSSGNQTIASRMLGISQPALSKRLKDRSSVA